MSGLDLSRAATADVLVADRPGRRAARRDRWLKDGAWYLVLTAIAVITVFPFAWILLTSLKGPHDVLFSVPPQLLPTDPTLDNYARVLRSLPIPTFFLNSVVASVAAPGRGRPGRGGGSKQRSGTWSSSRSAWSRSCRSCGCC